MLSVASCQLALPMVAFSSDTLPMLSLPVDVAAASVVVVGGVAVCVVVVVGC